MLGMAALAACSQQPQAVTVTGADRDAVLAYSEPKSDNLLAGLNAADYAQFSRDFDPKMKAAMTEAAFIQSRQTVTGKIGKYVSRQVDRIEKVGTFVRVTYNAKYEQEDGVTVLIVFNDDSAHQISGLWHTSPKLRAQ